MNAENTLCESSTFYYSRADVYERFSEAEDAPGFVAEFLERRTLGKRVLDLGCGTGKYLKIVEPGAGALYGLDQSRNQLDYARSKLGAHSNVTLLESSAEEIALPDHSVDVIYASWVLGTIAEEDRRRAVVDECMRVAIPGGEVFLIENDIGGEFEALRGRFPDIARTEAYNNSLVDEYGFEVVARSDSHFQFPRGLEARLIFGAIWGEAAGAAVQSAKVEHRIVIYRRVA